MNRWKVSNKDYTGYFITRSNIVCAASLRIQTIVDMAFVEAVKYLATSSMRTAIISNVTEDIAEEYHGTD